jgi:hypothetical protein
VRVRDGRRHPPPLAGALAEHRLGDADAAKDAAAKARAAPRPGAVWELAEVDLLAGELDAALPPPGK